MGEGSLPPVKGIQESSIVKMFEMDVVSPETSEGCGNGASAIGTKLADKCDVVLPGLGTKRHAVQADSLLDTD